jgi:hypothetical protein
MSTLNVRTISEEVTLIECQGTFQTSTPEQRAKYENLNTSIEGALDLIMAGEINSFYLIGCDFGLYRPSEPCCMVRVFREADNPKDRIIACHSLKFMDGEYRTGSGHYGRCDSEATLNYLSGEFLKASLINSQIVEFIQKRNGGEPIPNHQRLCKVKIF